MDYIYNYNDMQFFIETKNDIEAAVENYTTEITGDATTGYVVTNTHTPEKKETPKDPDISGKPGTPKIPKNSKTAKNSQETVKTGDTSTVMNWIIVCFISLGIARISYKRRKLEE